VADKKSKHGGHGIGRPEKWTADLIEKEAEQLIEWSKTDDAIILREFPASRGYGPQWLTYLADKSPTFSEALKIARCNVGVRREKMGLRGDVDAGIVKASLATYDDEHRAMLKEMKRAEKEGDLMKAFLAGQQAQRDMGKEN